MFIRGVGYSKKGSNKSWLVYFFCLAKFAPF